MTDRGRGPSEVMRVHVEALSWVNKFVGGPGTGQVVLTEEVPPAATVRAVLRQVTDRYAELGHALWDSGSRREIGDNIEVMVNNAVLGVSHDLDSPLLEDDRITLLGQYMGGCTPGGGSAAATERGGIGGVFRDPPEEANIARVAVMRTRIARSSPTAP